MGPNFVRDGENLVSASWMYVLRDKGECRLLTGGYVTACGPGNRMWGKTLSPCGMRNQTNQVLPRKAEAFYLCFSVFSLSA